MGQTNKVEFWEHLATIPSEGKLYKDPFLNEFYLEDNSKSITPIKPSQAFFKIEAGKQEAGFELNHLVFKEVAKEHLATTGKLTDIFNGVKSGFFTLEMFASSMEHYLSDSKSGLNPTSVLIARQIYEDKQGNDLTTSLVRVGGNYFFEQTNIAPEKLTERQALTWIKEIFNDRGINKEKLARNFTPALIAEFFTEGNSPVKSMTAIMEKFKVDKSEVASRSLLPQELIQKQNSSQCTL